MNRFWIALVSGLTLAAPSASAQPIGDVIWSFQAITADGDNVIEPHLFEDRIRIEAWADMTPDVNGNDIYGLARSVLDLANLGGAETGMILNFEFGNWLDLSVEGTVQPDNSITDIEVSQLPPAFNEFNDSDPLLAFSFDWFINGDESPRQVAYQSENHSPTLVFITALGRVAEWNTVSGSVRWSVIPTPGISITFLFGSAFLCNRRRR